MVKNIWQKTMFLLPDAATNFWENAPLKIFQKYF